jgi:hypothetical protein
MFGGGSVGQEAANKQGTRQDETNSLLVDAREAERVFRL